MLGMQLAHKKTIQFIYGFWSSFTNSSLNVDLARPLASILGPGGTLCALLQAHFVPDFCTLLRDSIPHIHLVIQQVSIYQALLCAKDRSRREKYRKEPNKPQFCSQRGSPNVEAPAVNVW